MTFENLLFSKSLYILKKKKHQKSPSLTISNNPSSSDVNTLSQKIDGSVKVGEKNSNKFSGTTQDSDYNSNKVLKNNELKSGQIPMNETDNNKSPQIENNPNFGESVDNTDQSENETGNADLDESIFMDQSTEHKDSVFKKFWDIITVPVKYYYYIFINILIYLDLHVYLLSHYYSLIYFNCCNILGS